MPINNPSKEQIMQSIIDCVPIMIPGFEKMGEVYYEAFIRDMPLRYTRMLVMGDFQTDGPDYRISRAARDYVAVNAFREGENLIIVGEKTGMGKSFDIAWTLWQIKKNFYWAMPQEIVRMSIKDANEIQVMKDCGILVIDDFDKINTGSSEISYQRNLMQEIIEHRRNRACLPTFITSNAGVDRLNEIYSEYTMRRIFQGCKYREVK